MPALISDAAQVIINTAKPGGCVVSCVANLGHDILKM